jgi:orotidine-5'-phosphate decarboxylase
MVARPEFHQQLQTQYDYGKFVCVGLDADYSRLPTHIAPDLRVGISTLPQVRREATFKFLTDIVDATADLVEAYKPNIAFYEDSSLGELALRDTVAYIHKAYPHIPVIGDVKRADIGSTNKGYAKAMFDRYNFDAITTNPYFGQDTYPPFTEDDYQGRGLIVLAKTSNKEAHLYQDAPTHIPTYSLDQAEKGTPLSDEELSDLTDVAEGFEENYAKLYEKHGLEKAPAGLVPMYLVVARRTATLAQKNPNIGLVVGATHPEAFGPVRVVAPYVDILIPGIGTQGGDLEETLAYAPNRNRKGMIINSASGIIYASSGRDYAEAARQKTLELDNRVRDLMFT